MVNRRGKSPNPTPQVSTAERELWSTVTADVKPLGGRSNEAFYAAQSCNNRGNDLKERRNIKQRTNLDPNNTPELRHGLAPGLERRMRLRLRRGQVNIEARLDLHGLDKIAASEALYGFLERAYMGGRKTVLVITGKGLRKGGEVGVLRQVVPEWLNTEPMRQWVHAFDHASPRDGGGGALYIVMRRRQR